MGDGTECPVVNAYGKGMNASVDCELGLALNHSGGYPGYGTYVLLLPEHDVGLFAFSNRPYDAPRGPIWDAAIALDEAGPLKGSPNPVRSEERRVGKEWFSTCRSRWSP